MTDKQFDMILDRCRDPDKATRKVKEFWGDKKRRRRLNKEPDS